MKDWEEAEFEHQQKSIQEWAKKQVEKTANGWWFRRKLAKLSRMVTIIYGEPMAAEIRFYVKDVQGRCKTSGVSVKKSFNH